MPDAFDGMVRTAACFFYAGVFDADPRDAKRLVSYGMQCNYRHRLRKLYRVYDLLKTPVHVVARAKKISISRRESLVWLQKFLVIQKRI